MQPFGDFQYGQMAAPRRLMVPHQRGQRGGSQNEALLSLSLSLSLSLPLSLSLLGGGSPLFELAGEDLFLATIPAALLPLHHH